MALQSFRELSSGGQLGFKACATKGLTTGLSLSARPHHGSEPGHGVPLVQLLWDNILYPAREGREDGTYKHRRKVYPVLRAVAAQDCGRAERPGGQAGQSAGDFPVAPPQ